jgi:hypothetical protein
MSVRVTAVALGKKISILYYECVSAILSHFLRRIWPIFSSLACVALFFPHYLTNGTLFGTRLLIAFSLFSLQLLSQTFPHYKKI